MVLNFSKVWTRRLILLHFVLLGFALSVLAACSAAKNDPAGPPVAIAPGDICAVCGMYITHYPGPRGEAYLQGQAAPLKFGSTRDFFAYITQPEVRSRLGPVYVQDTARIAWKHPSNAVTTFVNARKAYYVAWQPLAGAMGPTLASFSHRPDARAFIAAHGGELLRFDQITPELISMLDYTCPDSDAGPAIRRPGGSSSCVVKQGRVMRGRPVLPATRRP